MKRPRNIFLYTFGISAIFIGTVSNLSTQMNPSLRINAANNTVVASEPTIKDVTDLQKCDPPPLRASGDHIFSAQRAWAGEPTVVKNKSISVQTGHYFVVIGVYDKQADAFKALASLTERKLTTESYIAKNLTVVKSGNKFYVDYTGPLLREEAEKVYKLLRINDPKLSPQIIRLVTPPTSVSKSIQ
jgi:hypothetical protein